MNNKVAWGIIAVIILLIGGVFLVSSKKENTPQQNSIPQDNKISVPTPVKILNISLTKSGFQPKTLTINKGETVSWINKSSESGTVNSDPYPDNNLYRFLNLGEFPPQTTVQAIFNETGTFTYHNQFAPSQTGTIIVK
ncbi:MAG TPA: hypothetical protein VG917_02855 [Patescibacteria group bacterium]|nr:hypothetical protein [Patescibacteria group bacterium]